MSQESRTGADIVTRAKHIRFVKLRAHEVAGILNSAGISADESVDHLVPATGAENGFDLAPAPLEPQISFGTLKKRW